MYSQRAKSDARGISINNLHDSASVNSVSGETVQLYYNNSGTLTADAGQPAGTYVIGKLANNHVLNALGDSLAVFGDQSITASGGPLTTQINVSKDIIESMDEYTFVERLNLLQNPLPGQSSFNQPVLNTQGQFFVDFDKGVIYGLKGSSATAITGVGYKVPTSAVSSSGGSTTITGPLPAGTNQIGHVITDTGSVSTVGGNAASGSADSGNPVKVGGKYNSSPITLTNGQRGDVQMDASGNTQTREQYAAVAEDNVNGVYAEAIKPLATSTYSWSKFQNLQANATLNVKGSAGNVKSLYCHNGNAAARYIQLHNTATTPAGGATPIYSFLVPAAGTTLIDGQFFGENGANFATGIAFAFSTTEITYTAGSAGDQVTFIQYA